MELLGYLAAVLMGISLGLVGGGGSILSVPILFYFFHQDSLSATTNSLLIVGLGALVGAAINARKGNVDLGMGAIFAIPSFAGVYVARSVLLPFLPEIIATFFGFTMTKPILIMIAFASLMILASRAMIRSAHPSAGATSNGSDSHPRFISIGVQGFLVGCTTGFVGAGGGFLIIPALVVLLKLPMRKAIGTSLTIIAANSLFGFAISSLPEEGRNWPLLLSLSALGIIGIFIGQFFSSHLDERRLKQGFGYFVLFVGALILIDHLVML